MTTVDHTRDDEQKHATQATGNYDTMHRHKGNWANMDRITRRNDYPPDANTITPTS
jgi:hypothetical protein